MATEKPDRFIIDHGELTSIWNNEGPHPKYHREVKAKLKQEWPLLYKYIDDIVNFPTSSK